MEIGGSTATDIPSERWSAWQFKKEGRLLANLGGGTSPHAQKSAISRGEDNIQGMGNDGENSSVLRFMEKWGEMTGGTKNRRKT